MAILLSLSSLVTVIPAPKIVEAIILSKTSFSIFIEALISSSETSFPFQEAFNFSEIGSGNWDSLNKESILVALRSLLVSSVALTSWSFSVLVARSCASTAFCCSSRSFFWATSFSSSSFVILISLFICEAAILIKLPPAAGSYTTSTVTLCILRTLRMSCSCFALPSISTDRPKKFGLPWSKEDTKVSLNSFPLEFFTVTRSP